MGGAVSQPALETRRIATRVGTVHVACAGDGPPALLLHGIGSSADSFRAQFAGLADNHRVLAWDAPGYARSADPTGALDVDAYARTVVDVLDAVDVDRINLAGVSWGGVIATRAAINHPDRLSSLALIGSTPGRKGTPTVEDLERRCRLLDEAGPRSFAQGRAGRVLAQPADPELLAEVERNMAASIRPAGYRSAASVLAATRHVDELRLIAVRTLVIAGEADVVTGVAESRVLADAIPNAELIVVEGAGHLVNQERPEAVNAALRNHWNRRGDRA